MAGGNLQGSKPLRESAYGVGLPDALLVRGASAAVVGNTSIIDGLGVDDHLAQVSTSGTSSYLVDATGSTVAVGDSAGSISAAYTYAPYGATSASVSANTPFQYTGRENDGATNLDYYRARYYSATYNRFISEDPAGLFGGINPYGYVGGDPINRTDPSGKLGVVGAGIGAVVDGVGDLLYQMYVLDRSFSALSGVK